MINFQLKCKDLGFDSCNFISTGNSEDELKRKFYIHTMISHAREFEQMAEDKKIELHTIIKRILDDQNYN
jgi:predicted small metal-binding protein